MEHKHFAIKITIFTFARLRINKTPDKREHRLLWLEG
jgi:hypothetical protein